MSNLTRRHFLVCAASLAPCLLACSGEAAITVPVPEGVDVLPDSIRIHLSQVPSLTRFGGSLVIPEAHVIVIRAGDADYRAFSNVCTHAGCGIYAFVHPRIRCQCHSSEFDLQGLNVAGPALRPLPRFDAQRNSDGILTISRS